jgi:hypothetical protein
MSTADANYGLGKFSQLLEKLKWPKVSQQNEFGMNGSTTSVLSDRPVGVVR